MDIMAPATVRMIGFLFRPLPGQERALLEMLAENPEYPLPWTSILPCGHYQVYKTIEDVPLENVPCSCGDTGHWFVVWEDI